VTGTGRTPRAAVVALLPPAVAACVLVLLWAATTGPVRVFGPGSDDAVSATPPSTTPSPTADEAGDLPTYRDLTRDVRPTWDGSWVGELLLYTLLIGLALGALVLLRRLWRHRWRPPQRPTVVGDDVVTVDALATALEEDADAQLDAVAEGGPRDGIVACWLRLEEIAAAAGHAARPSETSAELVTRLLVDLDLDPRPIGRLAALYREARFSEHRLGEDSRAEARSALRALHDELRARGRVP
jgi:hypothetical protein